MAGKLAVISLLLVLILTVTPYGSIGSKAPEVNQNDMDFACFAVPTGCVKSSDCDEICQHLHPGVGPYFGFCRDALCCCPP
ncbi:unnamed protein product [Amaranthus hypochondriacus]